MPTYWGIWYCSVNSWTIDDSKTSWPNYRAASWCCVWVWSYRKSSTFSILVLGRESVITVPWSKKWPFHCFQHTWRQNHPHTAGDSNAFVTLDLKMAHLISYRNKFAGCHVTYCGTNLKQQTLYSFGIWLPVVLSVLTNRTCAPSNTAFISMKILFK